MQYSSIQNPIPPNPPSKGGESKIQNQIAIVGLACQYPDAQSPHELWENVLAQRRAFRRLPSERLSLEDYFASDRTLPDSIYSTEAAVIEGYNFDRVGFRVVGSTFRSADLAHWLALDMAAQALADAGFPDGEGLPRETTGVLLGNTLTGEFSRANTLRLRWPYVRRVVEAKLKAQGMSAAERNRFLAELEVEYKQPFAPIGEESLAGNLSNTIAGRICNHFDLKGGGYVMDGACSSSLLAVANACSALLMGDLDVALAGGVDLSLDPFELVGFAKAGALAEGEMRVYDARSAGFIPGEGCGFVVLMRYEDAIAQNRPIYSLIPGWGISSDGQGGITRPEVEGQLLAVQRAYRRAGFSSDTVPYFEGHGTGTAVGDTTELEVLSRAHLGESQGDILQPAVISSIKANIGHTKAAAGIAGLIKAIMAIHEQILPPMTGCEQPHPLLQGDQAALQILQEGQIWPDSQPLRAGVSSMGFGGINTHIVLEGVAQKRRQSLNSQERYLIGTPQDAELILLGAHDKKELEQTVDHLLNIAPHLSRAEVGDLGAELARKLHPRMAVRAAIVASHPQELTSRLEILKSWLSQASISQQNTKTKIQTSAGVFLGIGLTAPRLGFLFPGQAAPVYLDGGVWERRFPWLKELYAAADLPTGGDLKSTQIAQPAIVTASLAGLRVLGHFDIQADIAVGHSLGELSALHWGKAFNEASLLRIAKVRGQGMGELGHPTGTMASIGAGEREVQSLLNGKVVVIAGLNSPWQTVVSGERAGVNDVVEKAKAKGIKTVILPVSHAFHSPLVSATVEPLAQQLLEEKFSPLQGKVFSTVTGSLLSKNEDLSSLLLQQITSPVRFVEAVSAASQDLDLWIEVGSGRILSGLVQDFSDVPAIAMDASGSSFKGLLEAVGAAFALGTPINHHALFAERFTRPFNWDWQPQFFTNPCELAPVSVESEELGVKSEELGVKSEELIVSNSPAKSQFLQPKFNSPSPNPKSQIPNPKSQLDTLRQLVAERTELPLEAIKDNNRLLSDLHLNSISVSQLVIEATRSLGLNPPASPTDYADATIGEIAQALEELCQISNSTHIQEKQPLGVDSWIRTFMVELVESPLPTATRKVEHNPDSTLDSNWQIIAPENYHLSASLAQALNTVKEKGVIVCLPPYPDESAIDLLLEGAKVVFSSSPLTSPNPPYLPFERGVKEKKIENQFILIQHGGGAASFARTFHLENPQITTRVIDVPVDATEAIGWIVAEIESGDGYSEAYYDGQGNRKIPVLRLSPPNLPFGRGGEEIEGLKRENLESKIQNPKSKIQTQDVLLVTGGGKGIAAECALAIAKETGVKLAIFGRSQPEKNAELGQNLARMQGAGIQVKYLSVDVTKATLVQEAVHQIERELGTITAIIHGAGINQPKLIKTLDKNDFLCTLAPKVQGLQNILAAINPNTLKILISFGSIIARTGLPGEADYALANEWLGHLVEQFQNQHPHCHCLNLDWSVWSGTGMGERLGRIDILKQQGITPIPTDLGIKILRRLMNQALPTTSVVISGRFGEPPTLKIEQPELPFLRFLEQPKAYYPGIELIVDAELSTQTDPYLNDHIYQGERIFPGVMGLEAMAQVVRALVNKKSESFAFEEVQFNRPIVVAENDSLKIRIAALVQDSGKIEVVLRSEQTAFSIDHFRATCTPQSSLNKTNHLDSHEFICDSKQHPIHPQQDLYGNILFHQGRFQRLKSYRHLQATECIAEIETDTVTPWFSRYLPQDLILGDPGARDAVIHALQACVPQATILPIGVEKLVIHRVDHAGTRFVWAKERQHIGDRFIYDVAVVDDRGTVLEQWQGLQLQVIQPKDPQSPWVAPLLAPYLQRQIQEAIPSADISVVVDWDGKVERQVRRDRSLLGIQNFYRRPDGKPELNNGKAVSVAHTGDLTLVVSGSEGCDVEPTVFREMRVWQDLLGVRRFDLAQVVAQETGESLDVAATRIWCASECLKKAGMVADAPLLLMNNPSQSQIHVSASLDNHLKSKIQLVWLESGERAIATFVVSVRGFEEALVLAVLVEGMKEGNHKRRDITKASVV